MRRLGPLTITCFCIAGIATILYLRGSDDGEDTLRDRTLETPSAEKSGTTLPTSADRLTAVQTGRPETDDAKVDTDECLADGEPFLSGDIRLIGNETSGEGKYPQIARPQTTHEKKFNQAVKKLLRPSECPEGFGYSLSYLSKRFVSLSLWCSFCGASCHASRTVFNFDLIAGREIKNLAELFEPGSKYLQTIASYCKLELTRCDYCDPADQWFADGIAPKKANFRYWTVTRDGLEFIFNEYHLGPGVCEGATVLVAYSHLRGIVRTDIAWLSQVQGNSGGKRPVIDPALK